MSAAAPNPVVSTATISALPLPTAAVLLQAAKIAQEQDRPIQLDYQAETATGKALIGEDKETKEKVLMKSREEYTSLIQKVFKVGEDYLVLTENSIYIISGKVGKRSISMNDLLGNGDL